MLCIKRLNQPTIPGNHLCQISTTLYRLIRTTCGTKFPCHCNTQADAAGREVWKAMILRFISSKICSKNMIEYTPCTVVLNHAELLKVI